MSDIQRYREKPLSFAEEMDRWFGSLLDEFPSWGGRRLPAVDVRREDERYVVEFELPGLTEKDVDVSVEDDVLTIAHERKHESTGKDEGYVVHERRHSSFRRSFRLPADVQADKIKARVEDGLLTVELPRSPEAARRARKIPVGK